MGSAAEWERFDPLAVRAKFLAERAKRSVNGRADIRDLGRDEFLTRFRDDPITPVTAGCSG
jgi:hypothetical protein